MAGIRLLFFFGVAQWQDVHRTYGDEADLFQELATHLSEVCMTSVQAHFDGSFQRLDTKCAKKRATNAAVFEAWKHCKEFAIEHEVPWLIFTWRGYIPAQTEYTDHATLVLSDNGEPDAGDALKDPCNRPLL